MPAVADPAPIPSETPLTNGRTCSVRSRDAPERGVKANSAPGRRPDWVSDELFPFESHFVDIDGHRLHYIDEGSGPVLLLYHGNPTWSFLYRDIITKLRSEFRCVAFDYPGMGPSTADPNFTFRAADLAAVAEAFVEHLDLDAITPMVQDCNAIPKQPPRRARRPSGTGRGS